ncbi:hypothetical protein DMUE_0921 [Dictyocoela muelleri]|nr:hypothetical protein DMUE_0921 [Dictyocoela muelleri]
MYSFLESKTHETYGKFFGEIIDLLRRFSIELSPYLILIDFEYAAFNSIRDLFTNSEVRGCLFYFGQAIWRKLLNLGLKTMYTDDSNFRYCVNMITELSLIPIKDIDKGLDIIKRSFFYIMASECFIDYVENTWLTNNRLIFNLQIWSQHGV